MDCLIHPLIEISFRSNYFPRPDSYREGQCALRYTINIVAAKNYGRKMLIPNTSTSAKIMRNDGFVVNIIYFSLVCLWLKATSSAYVPFLVNHLHFLSIIPSSIVLVLPCILFSITNNNIPDALPSSPYFLFNCQSYLCWSFYSRSTTRF